MATQFTHFVPEPETGDWILTVSGMMGGKPVFLSSDFLKSLDDATRMAQCLVYAVHPTAEDMTWRLEGTGHWEAKYRFLTFSVLRGKNPFPPKPLVLNDPAPASGGRMVKPRDI